MTTIKLKTHITMDIMIPTTLSILPAVAMPALLEPAPILPLENPIHPSKIPTIGITNPRMDASIPSTSAIVAAPELSTVCTGTGYPPGICPSCGNGCCRTARSCSRLSL
jgi:hypothetical protein